MEKMEVVKEEAQNSKGNIQTQLEESLNNLKPLEDGQLVEGIVVQVSSEYVFLDIGYKSEGKIPVAEFADNLPKVGETVTVVLLRKDGRNGPEVSKAKADANPIPLVDDVTNATLSSNFLINQIPPKIIYCL